MTHPRTLLFHHRYVPCVLRQRLSNLIIFLSIVPIILMMTNGCCCYYYYYCPRPIIGCCCCCCRSAGLVAVRRRQLPGRASDGQRDAPGAGAGGGLPRRQPRTAQQPHALPAAETTDTTDSCSYYVISGCQQR